MTTLTINNELNGIELGFDSIPSQAIRDSLKGLGFRWHKIKKVWYAKNTNERLTFAENLTNEKITHSDVKTEKKFDFDVKVGDLFCCSWGYEQTNVDFFQVIELVGCKSVRVREVRPQMIEETAISGMSADRKYQVPTELLPPCQSVFINDNEKGDLKRLKSFASDGKSNPLFEIGRSGEHCTKYTGEVVYESWYC